jgi:hypothetical protein
MNPVINVIGHEVVPGRRGAHRIGSLNRQAATQETPQKPAEMPDPEKIVEPRQVASSLALAERAQCTYLLKSLSKFSPFHSA